MGILLSQKSTATSQVGKTSVVFAASPRNSKPPVQGFPGGLNSEPAVAITRNWPSPRDRIQNPGSPTILSK